MKIDTALMNAKTIADNLMYETSTSENRGYSNELKKCLAVIEEFIVNSQANERIKP